jgi:hypothetical protein
MADVRVPLIPWLTPNFASVKLPPGKREDGYAPAPTFALAELEPETLAKMCDDFRAEVFKKAGKADPATITLDKIRRAVTNYCSHPLNGTGTCDCDKIMDDISL